MSRYSVRPTPETGICLPVAVTIPRGGTIPDGSVDLTIHTISGMNSSISPASIQATIEALPGPYQPADLVTANDAIVRVARLDGEFRWHHHDEDELFLCWDGEFRIELAGGDTIQMTRGDVFVIPAGVEHRPVADSVAHCLLIEKPDTLQYGNQAQDG